MYGSRVAETKALFPVVRADSTARRMVSVSAALVTAGLAIVDPLGIGALRASEMPRFIAQQQLRPLQEALLAYTAQATAAEAGNRPLFDTSGSNRHPGDGVPPELLGAPELVTDRLYQLTTTEFRSTLNAARRDAGEARALADEMNRRASEISDRFGGGRDQLHAQEASREDARARPVIVLPAITPIADPQVGMSGTPVEMGSGASVKISREDTGRAPASVPSAVVLPSYREPVGSRPVDVGADQPSKLAQRPAAGREATDIVEVSLPSRPAAAPLPGLMSLGGSKKNETTGAGAAAASVENDPPATGAVAKSVAEPKGAPGSQTSVGRVAAGTSAGPKPVSVTPGAGPAPVERPRFKTSKASPVSPPLSAAAAYGYVPLSPPKDRSTKRAKAQPDVAPLPARNSATGMASKGGQAKHEPKSAALPAVPVTKAPGRSAAAVEPSGGAPQMGAGETGDENNEKKGLFSWFKPLGKPIEMPREIRSYGWAND